MRPGNPVFIAVINQDLEYIAQIGTVLGQIPKGFFPLRLELIKLADESLFGRIVLYSGRATRQAFLPEPEGVAYGLLRIPSLSCHNFAIVSRRNGGKRG